MLVRRNKYAAVLLCVAALAALWASVWLTREREPFHEGKPLTEWLASLDLDEELFKEPLSSDAAAARDAFAKMGISAVPFLKSLMTAKEGIVRRTYRGMHPRLPSAVQHVFPDPGPDAEWLRARCVTAISVAGREAAYQSVPMVLQSLSDPDYLVQCAAAQALGRLAPGTQFEAAAVRALIETIKPFSAISTSSVGITAGMMLAEFPAHCEASVPILLERTMFPAKEEAYEWIPRGEIIFNLIMEKLGTNALPAMANAAAKTGAPADAIERVAHNVRVKARKSKN